MYFDITSYFVNELIFCDNNELIEKDLYTKRIKLKLLKDYKSK